MKPSARVRILLERTKHIKSMRSSSPRLIIFFGVLGDFDSFEYAQTIARSIESLRSIGVEIYSFGIGSKESKEKFCSYTGYPQNILEVNMNADLHNSLGLSAGIGLSKPLINLLLMCSGIGSPGTLVEVIRGYTGDKSSNQIFGSEDMLNLHSHKIYPNKFFSKVFGCGYLRPFELATRRLLNMIEIISNWNTYIPSNIFLTQRGATFLIDEKDNLSYLFLAKSYLIHAENMSDPLKNVIKNLD